MEEFEILEKLGEGGFGEVFKAKSLKDGKIYAIKEIKNKSDDGREEIDISETIYKFSEFNDINLTSYWKIETKEGKKKLVCPFYNGGNLRQFIRNNKQITIEMIQYIMKNIIHGLNTLHSLKIIHRDIKSHNLMIDYKNENDKNILNSTIKIIDYGLAKYFYKKKIDDNSQIGTTNYRHHKINEIKFGENCDKKALNEEVEKMNVELDIWSLGIVFMELLTGKLLFDYSNKTKEDLKEFVKIEVYRIPFNENTSIELVSFIDEILQYKDQSTAKELCDHEFLNKDVKEFTPFPKDKAKEKLKIIDNKEYLELNFRKGPNFDYKKLYPQKNQEDLDALINKIFISLNEDSLFTDQILIPIIPQS
jgi:serine/threonine protein kinase